jgi:hypothetical protein
MDVMGWSFISVHMEHLGLDVIISSCGPAQARLFPPLVEDSLTQSVTPAVLVSSNGERFAIWRGGKGTILHEHACCLPVPSLLPLAFNHHPPWDVTP